MSDSIKALHALQQQDGVEVSVVAGERPHVTARVDDVPVSADGETLEDAAAAVLPLANALLDAR